VLLVSGKKFIAGLLAGAEKTHGLQIRELEHFKESAEGIYLVSNSKEPAVIVPSPRRKRSILTPEPAPRVLHHEAG
jgi:hypothetical protein